MDLHQKLAAAELQHKMAAQLHQKIAADDMQRKMAAEMQQKMAVAEMHKLMSAEMQSSAIENGLPPPSPRTPMSNGLHVESPAPSTPPSHPPRPQSYSSSGMPESPIDGSVNGRRGSTASTESNGINLDTAMVSQRIREILSTNNIGQRLFAKHVLGLSQGTVSELLSKPKHWDKLTEKGRESYRKMHAWSLDESNVLALKAISPRKCKEPGMSPGRYNFYNASSFEL